jgi:hypothetical protein
VRRTRTLLAACAVALFALAAFAASASAWTGSFKVASEHHTSPVSFKIQTSERGAFISDVYVSTRACGGVTADGHLYGDPHAFQSASGPASFRQWKPGHEVELEFVLSHHGNEVIATGRALAASGQCHERFDFRATSIVHGLT